MTEQKIFSLKCLLSALRLFFIEGLSSSNQILIKSFFFHLSGHEYHGEVSRTCQVLLVINSSLYVEWKLNKIYFQLLAHGKFHRFIIGKHFYFSLVLFYLRFSPKNYQSLLLFAALMNLYGILEAAHQYNPLSQKMSPFVGFLVNKLS